MSDKTNSSYRQILKATSIFGGVQVFNIIIALIRSKVIALLLGPVGFGISGILTSTADFISTLINAGISTSAVRFISLSANDNDDQKIVESVSVVRKLVWFTGLIGLILTVISSPGLSQFSFGNYDYTSSYIWLSLSILFQQLTSGRLVVLQGLQKLKYLALANLIGSSLGLLIALPLYFVFNVKAIPLVIVCGSLTALGSAWFFSSKLKINSIHVSRPNLVSKGKELVTLGFFLSISSLISIGTSYILRIYIGKIGGLGEVGLFTAGFAIINTYVGVVFQAMSTDYYPRLSAQSNNLEKSNLIVNQQSEVSILILGPILCGFLVFIKWIIILFYSERFNDISDMLYWAALGIYFKAPAWALAFIYLTKGKTKLFFWNELLANIYILLINILGYWWLGLEGLGISFLIGYLIYLFQIITIAKFKFNITLKSGFLKVFLIHSILGISAFCLTKFATDILLYSVGSVIIITSTIYSTKLLMIRLK
jgi:O-antigen/teichoic acid export membrane protein